MVLHGCGSWSRFKVLNKLSALLPFIVFNFDILNMQQYIVNPVWIRYLLQLPGEGITFSFLLYFQDMLVIHFCLACETAPWVYIGFV